MADKFATNRAGLSSPAENAVAIAFAGSPAADHDLSAQPGRALWVGGAGSVIGVLSDDDTEVTFAAVPAGTLLPFRFKTIKATSTATLMVAVW